MAALVTFMEKAGTHQLLNGAFSCEVSAAKKNELCEILQLVPTYIAEMYEISQDCPTITSSTGYVTYVALCKKYTITHTHTTHYTHVHTRTRTLTCARNRSNIQLPVTYMWTMWVFFQTWNKCVTFINAQAGANRTMPQIKRKWSTLCSEARQKVCMPTCCSYCRKKFLSYSEVSI